jgi:hypothetical protein
LQAKPLVELTRDFAIDLAALGWRLADFISVRQVSTSRDHVGITARRQELADALGLMLAVAIDRHQEFVTVLDCVFKCGDQCRAIAAVLFVACDADIVASSQQIGSAVGGTIVNDENVGRVTCYFIEHGTDVSGFIVNGQGGEKSRLWCHDDTTSKKACEFPR